MGIGPHDGYRLRLFGAHVKQGFDHTAYHVGSSLTEKRGWRDVDVRVLLPDDEFAAYFGDPTKVGWDAPKRMMWELAWTMLGKSMTGLPIDFQIQAVTLANKEFSRPRSALLILDTDLPFVRTGKAA